MKPLKSEFSLYVQFTPNIEDRLLNFHIEDAFLYSIKPKLGYPTDSSTDIAVSIYDMTEDDALAKPQLKEFYDKYLKRYWILLAFKRFLTNHGNNVTQFGYTKMRDPEGTFEPISGEERAIYLRQLQHDINITETNLFVELNARQWTFDSFTYKIAGRNPAKKSFGISAVGHKDKRRGCNPRTEMILPLPSSSDNGDDDYGDDYN